MSAAYDFTLKQGDTPSLAIRLWAKDPQTWDTVRLPTPDTYVTWTVEWPTGTRTLSTRDGGLPVDDETGVITYPATGGDLQDLDLQVAPYRVQVTNDAGYTVTHLEGTITMQGAANG